MIPALYVEHYFIPSLQDLKQQRLATRGLEDGLAGKRPSSQAPEYSGAYERGGMFRRAAAREIALTFGPSCRCPTCREIYEGAIGGTCQCTPTGTLLEWGLATLYGPGEPDDDSDFYAPEDLRQLCLDGVEVLTLEGERLNEQILVQ